MQLRPLFGRLGMISAWLMCCFISLSQPAMPDTALPSADDILSRRFSSFQKLYYLANYEKKYLNEIGEGYYLQSLAVGYSLYGNQEKAISIFQKSDNSI